MENDINISILKAISLTFIEVEHWAASKVYTNAFRGSLTLLVTLCAMSIKKLTFISYGNYGNFST